MEDKAVATHQDSAHSAYSPEEVVALPQSVQRDGGLLLDTKGQEDLSLKLAADGHTVLLPQPTASPSDPLNWSWTRKHIVLFTVAWAALTADVTSTAGTSIIFPQAMQWHMTPNAANQPNAIAVLLNGLGGLAWVVVSGFWGRAPVMFWTSVFGLAFNIGAALSSSYEAVFANRALSAWFLTSGQVISISFLRDIFFFHERARKIGLWAVLYIASPYLGPCLGNFVTAKTHHWPDVYWMCTGCAGIQMILVALFIDETWFNRDITEAEQPVRSASLGGRISRLVGVWQVKHRQHYFPGVGATCKRLVVTITKPAFALICLAYFLCFAWAIGINISTNLLLATPKEAGGYGLTTLAIGYVYFVCFGGVFIGEAFGHFFNDYMARRYIQRHKGVYEPEVRLWTFYVAIAVMVPALVLIGQALGKLLPLAVIIAALGIYTFGVMVMSVTVTAYGLDSHPTAPAEISGWLQLARTAGGFSVGYYQQPWLNLVGAEASFGTQAGIVGFALVPVIAAHVFGRRMRRKSGPIA